jgi:putative SOS response-associated peptidase YedK
MVLRQSKQASSVCQITCHEQVRLGAFSQAILRPADYERWLGSEPDPHDLLIKFPSEPMKMWPISKRVNSPRNDDEDLLAEVDLAAAS